MIKRHREREGRREKGVKESIIITISIESMCERGSLYIIIMVVVVTEKGIKRDIP